MASCGKKKAFDVKSEVSEYPIIVIWELKSEMGWTPCDVKPCFVEFLYAAGEFVLDVLLESAVGVSLIFKVCSEGFWGGTNDGDLWANVGDAVPRHDYQGF